MRVASLVLLLASGAVSAVTFTEDFEGFSLFGLDPTLKPDQDWYNYVEGFDVGNLTAEAPIPEGTQAFRFNSSVDVDLTTRSADFRLAVPIQLEETTFTVVGTTPNDNGIGSQQFVMLESSSPRRSIVEFYVFCRDTSNPDGCELRVRTELADTTGAVLINTSVGQTEFEIRVVFDWFTAEFQLFVDGVDDGTFPMLELPQDVGRLHFGQYRSDVPWVLTFDNWTVVGASDEVVGGIDADVAEGLQNFARDIRFTSGGSLFMLGLVVLIVLLAAVAVPMIILGLDNSTVPAIGFYGVLCVLWLVVMEWWPDWVGIALIITAASMIGMVLRKATLGIGNADSHAGLVVGALGYFIIASALLGFSGYAAEDIVLPTGQPDIVNDAGNETTDNQSFLGAVSECIFTGGAFTFGLTGDCSQTTVSKTWEKFTDAAATIFNWARTGMDFLFQLLTFRLPIPVIFNIMIVLPPAAALATVGISIVRGVS